MPLPLLRPRPPRTAPSIPVKVLVYGAERHIEAGAVNELILAVWDTELTSDTPSFNGSNNYSNCPPATYMAIIRVIFCAQSTKPLKTTSPRYFSSHPWTELEEKQWKPAIFGAKEKDFPSPSPSPFSPIIHSLLSWTSLKRAKMLRSECIPGITHSYVRKKMSFRQNVRSQSQLIFCLVFL